MAISVAVKQLYMYDVRTKEEAERDIRKGNERAKQVMKRFKKYLTAKYGEEPIIEENGCESGYEDCIIDIRKVNEEPDYIVNGHLIEVKTALGIPKVIWLKKSQTDKLVKKGGHILFAMGDFEEGNLFFTLINNGKLKEIVEDAKVVYPTAYGCMKACYEVSRNQFVWDYLPNN